MFERSREKKRVLKLRFLLRFLNQLGIAALLYPSRFFEI
jgi:hypothetical protein